MASVFDTYQKDWTYTAVPSALLYNTQLPLPPKKTATAAVLPTQSSEYWANATRGLDFSAEDKLDGETYNRILWKGPMGTEYPESISGANCARAALLSCSASTKEDNPAGS